MCTTEGGYSSKHDEWKDLDEVVEVGETPDSDCDAAEKGLVPLAQFPLYHDLACRIKAALSGQRKSNPCVRLEMPFDRILFDGGLKARAVTVIKSVQRKKYTIQRYSDLEDLLGKRWHLRGSNKAGDYCYVILDTVEFYIYDRKPLVDYCVGPDGRPLEKKQMRGCMLTG